LSKSALHTLDQRQVKWLKVSSDFNVSPLKEYVFQYQILGQSILRLHSICPNQFRFHVQMFGLGFGVVALATSVTTFPFQLNVSAKTFMLYDHVHNND